MKNGSKDREEKDEGEKNVRKDHLLVKSLSSLQPKHYSNILREVMSLCAEIKHEP